MSAGMHRLDVDVLTEDPRWTEAVSQAAPGALEDTIPAIVLAALVGGGAPPCPISISVLLADDARVQALNRTYRGKDAPTNVLSFALAADDDMTEAEVPGEPLALGDIALAYETVVAEATADGKPIRDHLYHLVVHGTLHLLGYDHIEEEDATVMERLEVGILATLGIADPYALPADPGDDQRPPLSPEAI